MAEPVPGHWQIQEAKQRFSEMIRAVTSQGPQVITRHGEDIAVVIDVREFHRLTRAAVNLTDILLGGPKVDDSIVDVFAEIEAERKTDLERPIDLGNAGDLEVSG
jgi:prevent-host-death family protein